MCYLLTILERKIIVFKNISLFMMPYTLLGVRQAACYIVSYYQGFQIIGKIKAVKISGHGNYVS